MASLWMAEQIGRVLGDRYRLLAPIGRGASAQVFVADDVRLRRQVAVKVLHDALADDQEFLRRFRAEAQAAAALSHPHVLAVYDWGEDDDGVPWIVTEYLGGGSLRALLDRGHRLTPSQALAVGVQAAKGLEYAHRRGFVHRDIKPANLLFDDDGRLRIADFGLARALAEAAWTEPQGAVVGTARYASPEQAQGLALTGRADVYSLALVVTEAVTGEVPFATDTTLGTLMARVGRPLVAPEALGALGEPVEAAGHPDPEERLDARGLAEALARVAATLPRPAPLPLAGAVDGEDPDLTMTGAPPAPGGEPGAGVGRAAALAGADRLAADGTATALDADLAATDATVVVPLGGADREGTAGPPVAAPTGPGREESPPLFDAAEDDDWADEVEPEEVDDEEPWDPRSPTGRRRRRWPWITLAMLLLAGAGVAAGLLVADLAEGTPTHVIPPVEGLSEQAARATLTQLGFLVDVEETRRDGTVAGDVLGTRPSAGTELEEGEEVTIIVSQGPTLVDRPDLPRGLPEGEARARLEAVGLVPVVTTRFDEEVPEGQVLEVVGDPGPRLERGTEVEVVVSQGPEPRTIPDGLVGAPQADVVAALEALALVPVLEQDFSDDVDAGLVMAINPGAGVQVPRGEPVTVLVSLGPNLVTVPDVRGATSLDEAAALLEAQGLVAGEARGPARGVPSGTRPGAGERVRPGTTVDILLSRPDDEGDEGDDD